MDQLYSNIRLKQAKVNSFTQQIITLEDLLKADAAVIDEKQIIEAFVLELKGLLGIEDLAKLIEKIFSLQFVLEKLTLHVPGDIAVPNLDEFYKLLSPILMRSLQEHMLDQKSPMLSENWKNAICIAIEEEIYLHKNSDH